MDYRSTPRDHRNRAPFSHDPSLADRNGVLILGNFLAEGPVDTLGLKEDDGIGIANGTDEQPLGVVG